MAPPGRYAGHLGIRALFQREAWFAALRYAMQPWSGVSFATAGTVRAIHYGYSVIIL